MHFGRKNPKHAFHMGDTVLEASSEERDLGVIVDAQFTFDTHINEMVKRGNKISDC
jgi:hypothetical protein